MGRRKGVRRWWHLWLEQGLLVDSLPSLRGPHLFALEMASPPTDQTLPSIL